MSIVMLAFPLIVNVLAVWYWRGSYRRIAIIVLPFLALAFAVDLFGSLQGSNLAGIWSIVVGSQVLLLLLVCALVQKIRKRKRR